MKKNFDCQGGSYSQFLNTLLYSTTYRKFFLAFSEKSDKNFNETEIS